MTGSSRAWKSGTARTHSYFLLPRQERLRRTQAFQEMSKRRPVEHMFPCCSLESSDTKRAMLVSCVISLARHPLTGPAVHRDPSAICSPTASCRTATSSFHELCPRTGESGHRYVAGWAAMRLEQGVSHMEGHDVHTQYTFGRRLWDRLHCTSSSCGVVLEEVQAAPDAHLPPTGTSCRERSRCTVLAPPHRLIFQSPRPPSKMVMMLGSRLFRGR